LHHISKIFPLSAIAGGVLVPRASGRRRSKRAESLSYQGFQTADFTQGDILTPLSANINQSL
jgi:hypothetical protein